ncbi:copper resistance protein NlpE [Rheinheimera baltica]|uniref:copper resistance protein NlpE n=1 Tax=Rheinheimera baltica TaxID=67576 RepID=UPI00273FEC4F|nr:copper resistance protein NlpE [Rheinheimera baltica]MDP5188405.1 copper resistance protein NlpE [Rheinheimera baltica]
MKTHLSIVAVTLVLLLAACDSKTSENSPNGAENNNSESNSSKSNSSKSNSTVGNPVLRNSKVNSIIVPDSEHSARNSLDWVGTYEGMLPCADCEGINTTVVLAADFSYQLTRVYVGKDAMALNSRGQFSWNEAGSTVLLEAEQPVQFFVGENQLFMLDPLGKRITGELAARYRLTKQQDTALPAADQG